jgi:EAL domain-containing protein (putative c-di-GMP-specific phosphodiesterase class I)
MYRAKERGRARYEFFDERMRVRTLVRMRTENDLRHALALGQLEVHYQPIVALRDSALAGFEALLRWTHPRRGSVPPGEFIPIAEDSGLIADIGSWVLRRAAAQVVEWRGRGGPAGWPLMIGVNVSARQFATGTVADEVALVMHEYGLGPDELAIELTESVLMEETAAAVDTLQALKAMGVRMILDDFGTGYSSLSYLERFPLDGLKIDRSFVAGLDGGGPSAIVTAIVSMAQSLDIAVTAEGVETPEQLDQLRSLGINYAQGFYFGRPGPPPAHAELLGTDLRRAAAGRDADSDVTAGG